MTLTPLQHRVLSVIAQLRDETSYLAGGATLNRATPRISDDLDIFQDEPEAVTATAERDLAALRAAGYRTEVTVESFDIVEAVIRDDSEQTMLQWQDETRRRFFPIQPDAVMGFRLHDADLAVNKFLCAARRREPRDLVDLVLIAARYCPLGPLAWAAPAKLPGDARPGPGRLLASAEQWAREVADVQLTTVRSDPPISAAETRAALSDALAQANRYVRETAPVAFMERLFVEPGPGRPVEADIAALEANQAEARACSLDGAFPKVAG